MALNKRIADAREFISDGAHSAPYVHVSSHRASCIRRKSGI